MSEPAVPPLPRATSPDRPAPGGSNNPRRSNNPRITLHDTVGAVFLGLLCLVLAAALVVAVTLPAISRKRETVFVEED